MTAKVFLDTNLWVYFYTQDPQNKYQAVAELVHDAGRSLIVSTQILGELYNVLTALKISDRYGYTYWDSLILATAILNNCSIVYSEDMQHNQLIDQAVRIINPLQ